MDQKVLDYLTKERVSVLAVTLPDNLVYAATLHFSHNEEPFELYFSTENASRKCRGLLNGEIQKASFVVGFSESEWITLQMDGEVTAVFDKSKLEEIYKLHYVKHPNSAKYKDDPAAFFEIYP